MLLNDSIFGIFFRSFFLCHDQAEARRQAAIKQQADEAAATRAAFLQQENQRRQEEAQRADNARLQQQQFSVTVNAPSAPMVPQLPGYPPAQPQQFNGGYPGASPQGGILAGALGGGSFQGQPQQTQQFAPVNQPSPYARAPQYQSQQFNGGYPGGRGSFGHQPQFQPQFQQQQPPPQQQLMAVQCPQGVYAGQALRIQTPDGRQMQVNVPQGIGPGQTFHVRCA